MKSGYIYLISNPAFPQYLKVGITEDISARLSQYQTADPKRSYKIEYYIKHSKYKIAERKIKEMMKYFATDTIQRGEWFKIPKHMAISRLDETLDDYNNDPEKY